MSFEKEDRRSEGVKIKQFNEKLKSSIPNYPLAQSRLYGCLEDYKAAVLEAIYACTYADFMKRHSCNAAQMGEYGLLLEIGNKARLREYRDRIKSKIY